MRFRKPKYHKALDEILEVVDRHKLRPLEAAYLCVNVALKLGVAVYDREFINFEATKHDFKFRPSLGGALILQAHALHELLQILSTGESEDDGWERALPSMMRTLVGRKADEVLDTGE